MAMFIFATAYVLYIARARLAKRIAPARLGDNSDLAPTRLRWNAVNVALHWLIYAILITQTASGIFLYAGHGSWIVTLHRTLAFVTLGYIGVHVSGTFHVWRPGAIASLVPRGAYPRRDPSQATAAPGNDGRRPDRFCGDNFDFATRDHLHVGFVSRAPKLDCGVLDDTAWQTARPVYIRTMEGANLGGTGKSPVEMRAVQDQDRIYFCFRWEDPSRSLRRLPIIKLEDGWHMTGHDAGSADVVDFYEDKFAVIFSDRGRLWAPAEFPICTPVLLPTSLHRSTTGASITQRTARSSTCGNGSHRAGEPWASCLPCTSDPSRIRRRIRPPGRPGIRVAIGPIPGTGSTATTSPSMDLAVTRNPSQLQRQRLPKDLKALQKSMGKFDMGDPDASVEEGSIWWLDDENSLPYTKELDASIPVGTIRLALCSQVRTKVIAETCEPGRSGRMDTGRWRSAESCIPDPSTTRISSQESQSMSGSRSSITHRPAIPVMLDRSSYRWMGDQN